MHSTSQVVFMAGAASLIATLACGLGALPVALGRVDLKKHVPLGYAFAGGLMYSASVFNLIGPHLRSDNVSTILLLLLGIFLGCFFLYGTDKFLANRRFAESGFLGTGSKRSLLILIAMFLHSFPEGVAVGVGYASGIENFGTYIAVAIAIHNIPEGLAIAIPYRAEGASISKCFWLAVLSNIPQPIAAVPAALMVSFFKPLLIPSFGFAAGAMMYLVLLEMIPAAVKSEISHARFAWVFMFGFCLMLLVQVVI